jgi:16S rRNA (guanine966-N2)-methyltransferase
VRVVAGRLGGRRLRAPRGRDTRPTSDRVREALFSMLGSVEGERVLDLFAGSGALAIEALSRGAASATLVERDARAVGVRRANLEALGLGSDEAKVVHATAEAALRDASRGGDTYDLVLLDPPYRDATAWGRELARALPAVLAPNARVVAESDRRAPLDLDLPVIRERRYGDTLIRIHATHGT